jgi:hypothetical protein
MTTQEVTAMQQENPITIRYYGHGCGRGVAWAATAELAIAIARSVLKSNPREGDHATVYHGNMLLATVTVRGRTSIRSGQNPYYVRTTKAVTR